MTLKEIRSRGRWLVQMAAVAAAVAGWAVAAPAVAQDEREEQEEHEVERRAPWWRALEALPAGGSRIGVTVQEVEANEASGAAEGALVTAVRSGSAADEAGLEAGDVVVTFDGERVRGARQLARLVGETPAGRSVAATVVRGAERRELRITVQPGRGPGGLPEGLFAGLGRLDLGGDRIVVWDDGDVEVADDGRSFTLRPPRAPGGRWGWSRGAADRARPPRLGVRVQAIDGQLADYFGVEEGVLVTSVEFDSPAARAGLRAGDVITAVGESPVASVRALRRQLADESPAALTIVRDGAETQVTAELDEPQRARPRVRVPI